ncbi:MAG: molybdate ABC transporter substrate-binding protein [Telluria sp.]
MKTLFAILLACLPWLPAQAAPLLVAAASDLAWCTGELAAAFHAEAPDAELKFSTGSSGNFFAQIRNGAPFEVFLSADTGYPSQLARLGAADGRTLTTYAIGRLALWTLDGNVDLGRGLAVLRDPRSGRLAIANPATAPYGRAARALLERNGLWDTVQPKLVIGENIAQTAQFVQSGNAQLGMVSLSLLRSPRLAGVGRYIVLPDGDGPIEQAAIVTTAGRDNPLAARFVRFLASPAARAIFERHGFALPRKPSA